ncbi:MAG: circadian clock KaiB family protein [bacterium]|nr:circadian clock KaiB family protein [bacterium]
MNKSSDPTGAYRFVLFVADNEPNSVLAKENLEHICKEYLHAGYTVSIVDVLEDFQAALDNDILLTPTLLVEGPRGRRTILGNLSEIDRIILALGSNV